MVRQGIGVLGKYDNNILGIFVEEVFIKDMLLTPEMQNDLSAAAKNQRIAQSKVISAKADVESAKLMRQAADYLDSQAAMQIRFLETLQLMSQQSNPKVNYALIYPLKLIFLPLSPNTTVGDL